METELKFRINEEQYQHFKKGGETVRMHAVYYDTRDRELGKRGIALRLRKEGDRSVLTVKYGGSAEEGLHKREEINIEGENIAAGIPQISRILGNIAAEELEETVVMDFDRTVKIIERNGTEIEMAADRGYINGKMPLCELELELLKGNEADLLALGRELRERYGLEYENRSKLERGLLNTFDGV